MSEPEQESLVSEVDAAITRTFLRPALNIHAANLLKPKGSTIGDPEPEFSGSTNEELLDYLDWEEITTTESWMKDGCTYYKAFGMEVFSELEQTCMSVVMALVHYKETVTIRWDGKSSEYTAECPYNGHGATTVDYLTMCIGPHNDGPEGDGEQIVYFVVAGTPAAKQSEIVVDDISEQLGKINCVMGEQRVTNN